MGETVTVALAFLVAVGAVVAGGVGGHWGGAPSAGSVGGHEGGTQSAGASGDATAASGGSRTITSDRVRVAADDAGVDVSASLPWGGVSLSLDDDGAGEGHVTHPAIDDGAVDAARAGACAVGLSGSGSPLDLAFDAGNSTFQVAWSANASSGGDSSGGDRGGAVDATAVVAECSSAGGG